MIIVCNLMVVLNLILIISCIIYIVRSSKKTDYKPEFKDIRKTRPSEGSHILVWDCVDKRIIPTPYKGTQEDWENSKDKETRYTHFFEIDLPS